MHYVKMERAYCFKTNNMQQVVMQRNLDQFPSTESHFLPCMNILNITEYDERQNQ